MKERIVIEETKEFRPHPALREGVNCIDTKYCKCEQVPETWEELKELCKNIKGCYIGENYISLSEKYLSFLNDGQIRCHCYNITNNATIYQMWQIINNLVVEK